MTVHIKWDNLKIEPKIIVFFSQLLLLFQFCPTCKSEKAKQIGTLAEVSTSLSEERTRKKIDQNLQQAT